jgi:hypothetical protein
MTYQSAWAVKNRCNRCNPSDIACPRHAPKWIKDLVRQCRKSHGKSSAPEKP